MAAMAYATALSKPLPLAGLLSSKYGGYAGASVATVSTPGLCSARVDLLQAAADEVAAAAEVALVLPVAAGAEPAAEELLEFELPHAAISTAVRAGTRIVKRRRGKSTAHNLQRRGGHCTAPCAPEIVGTTGPAQVRVMTEGG